MAPGGFPAGDLAIDYGTSNTVAVIRPAHGRARQLLFDGSPLLASAVYADDGMVRAGRDAVRAARLDPARYEPNPKRRIDDVEVLLGGRVYPVGELIAATLRRVHDEAVRTLGHPPGRVILTHPATWGPVRRTVLFNACVRAGLPGPVLIAEPVAAATHFAALPHTHVGPGQAVVVYDLGAGTFDVSVVRCLGNGFDTLAYRGLDDVGGVDFDALLVAYAGRGLSGRQAEAWQRVIAPQTTEDRRHHRLLWDDAREAKEALSRQNTVGFPLPVVDHDAMVTRTEFEAMARPLLVRTVEETVATIRQSGVGADRLAGLFLVGGGSRIPLAATLLHHRCRIAPTALEQPELVVAEGALAVVSAAVPAAAPQPPAGSRTTRGNGPPPDLIPPRVHAPLPTGEVWPSAPPTGEVVPSAPPTGEVSPAPPALAPVWPAEATAGTRTNRRGLPRKVWYWLIPLITAVLTFTVVMQSPPPVIAIGAGIVAIAIAVKVRSRRRQLRLGQTERPPHQDSPNKP